MAQFEEEIRVFREDKDSFFRSDIDSPIPLEQRSTFKGLNYYPPTREYNVPSRLKRFDKPEPISIATGTGTRQAYLKYGILEFEVKKTRLRLTIYKSAEDPFARSLFIPFSDATSGSETYWSGRYMDLEEQGGDIYELDFNKAYSPYCAYNDQYTCPIPPKENKLPVEILAGEKKYK